MVLVDGRGLGLQISTWDPHHEVYMRTVPGKHWLRCEGFKERVNHSAVKKEDDCSRFTNMNCLGVLKDQRFSCQETIRVLCIQDHKTVPNFAQGDQIFWDFTASILETYLSRVCFYLISIFPALGVLMMRNVCPGIAGRDSGGRNCARLGNLKICIGYLMKKKRYSEIHGEGFEQEGPEDAL